MKTAIIDGIEYDLVPKKKTRVIDWSKMPVDTIVEAMTGNTYYERYFKEKKGENFVCFAEGTTSLTSPDSGASWRSVRLIDNPWRVWFGGDMPCCGNVRVEILCRDGKKYTAYADTNDWSHTGGSGDIIAFKMLAEESHD